MKQYHELLEKINKQGTKKESGRSNMPNTTSLFGPQMEFDLQDGFPAITTKKLYWKGVVVELLWFLRGDTNIKYLVDNGCNIWNEDSFQYYQKLCKEQYVEHPVTFEQFVDIIKGDEVCHNTRLHCPIDYQWGDCGVQYGKLWRNWDGVDQFKDLIIGLQNNPYSRRHIITAWNPTTLNNMALNACHALFQFNCRKLTEQQRFDFYWNTYKPNRHVVESYETHDVEGRMDFLDSADIPKYYLDCKLLQRSADVVLGVPFNTASYALLISIIGKMVNMVPGKFVHSFGDVHIYDNHQEAVSEQLLREPYPLPILKFAKEFEELLVQWSIGNIWYFSEMIEQLKIEWFKLENYQHHPSIKAELSTGLVK